jgi:hypothetical protein
MARLRRFEELDRLVSYHAGELARGRTPDRVELLRTASALERYAGAAAEAALRDARANLDAVPRVIPERPLPPPPNLEPLQSALADAVATGDPRTIGNCRLALANAKLFAGRPL